MAAGFWALINRALTVDARSLRPHLYRLIFVGVNCLSVLWCEATSMVFGAPGLRLFQSIAHIDMMLLTIAGFSIFATVISEEKEDRLIGLLKMTGVSHAGLILGKSTSRMISVLMLLVVQMPFTLFAVTLGGILMHQMLAAYLALFAYLVFVANLGLFCSVVSPSARSAAGLAGVLLVCYFTMPSIAWALVGRVPAGSVIFWDDVIEFTAQASVVYRLNETMATGFTGSPWCVQVWTNLAAGGVFFAASWLLFDACTQGDDGAGALGLLSIWKRTSRRSRPCWDAALVWKDFQFVTGGCRMLLVKLGVILLLIVAVQAISQTWSLQDIGGLLLAVIIPILILESALYASRVFRDELQHKTWSTLLMLPRSTREIAFSKLLGCSLALVPGAVLLCGGILLASGGIEGLAEVMFGPWLWSSILPLLVFVCLTAWLSIHLKWGALPAALVITLFAHNCVISPLVLISMLLIGLGSGRGFEAFGQPADYISGAITSLGFGALTIAIGYGFMVFIVRDLDAAGER